MRRQANITRPAHPADEVAPLGKGNDHTKPLDALATEMGLPPATMPRSTPRERPADVQSRPSQILPCGRLL